MDIFLIRHTTPAVEKGICYGQTDLNLADSFSAELQTVKNKLTAPVDTVYTSPLKRCAQLANALGESIQEDNRLMEVNFGDWEMTPWNDIPVEELNPWMSDFVVVAPPNGESFEQLINRVEAFFQEVLISDAKSIAVVAHAGVIRAALGFFLGLAPQNLFRLSIGYGSISQVKSSKGNHQLVSMNH